MKIVLPRKGETYQKLNKNKYHYQNITCPQRHEQALELLKQMFENQLI